MEHICQPIRSVVSVPMSDCVVGVHVTSQSHILPLIEDGSVSPPDIPTSLVQHIIRTEDTVVVVKIHTEIISFPRFVTHAAIEALARPALLDALEKEDISPSPEAYAEGLRAMTQRLVNKMRGFGVKVT